MYIYIYPCSTVVNLLTIYINIGKCVFCAHSVCKVCSTVAEQRAIISAHSIKRLAPELLF
jgi:hypothetical protein